MSKKMFFVSIGNGLDSDVVAFLTATGIVDNTIANALNDMVLDLKSNNLWNRMKAIYPMVGGTAFTHKFNLKNPLDADSAFRLNFVLGWTHSANGAKPNGINGFANTFLVPSTELTTTSGHLFYYSRTNSSIAGYDIGASNDLGAVVNTVSLICRYNNNTAYANYGNGSYACNIASTDSRGGFMTNRNDGTNTTLWKNGSKLKTQAEAVTLTNVSLYLGGIHTATTQNFLTDRQCALASIGGGFSDAEALIYYNIVQTFQTALGRQV